MDSVNTSVNTLRLVGLSVVLGLVGISACAPEPADPPEGEVGARDAVSSRTADEAGPVATGAVRGVIRDSRTDAPVSGAHVSAGGFSTSTDDMGGYVLPLVPRGRVDVHAYLRGFRPESTSVTARPGELTTVDLSLAPAEPPCCGLAGEWSAEFVLDSAGLNPSPGARRLTGRMAFRSDGTAVGGSATRIAAATGTSDLDFSSLLDGGLSGEVGAIAGEVFHNDSVAITLQPRFGDWAIELRGRAAADTVRGSWFQRASCCGAYGHFLLVRD